MVATNQADEECKSIDLTCEQSFVYPTLLLIVGVERVLYTKTTVDSESEVFLNYTQTTTSVEVDAVHAYMLVRVFCLK